MKSFRTIVFWTHLACGAAARLRRDPSGQSARPGPVTLDGNTALLVDPYTGAIIGEPPAALRAFFRTMTTDLLLERAGCVVVGRARTRSHLAHDFDPSAR